MKTEKRETETEKREKREKERRERKEKIKVPEIKGFSGREYRDKFFRLKDLEEEGFNIPRFIFIEKTSELKYNREDIEKALFWAKRINEFDKDQIFNIRTFRFFKKSNKEISSLPHIVDIKFRDLEETLIEAARYYSILLDAETPNDGRIAGTIFTGKLSKLSKLTKYNLEFVIKEKRAMVRDIEKEGKIYRISGILDLNFKARHEKYLPETVPGCPEDPPVIDILEYLVRKTSKFYKQDIIFEFTYFSKPSGKFFDKDKNIIDKKTVFWEYRRF